MVLLFDLMINAVSTFNIFPKISGYYAFSTMQQAYERLLQNHFAMGIAAEYFSIKAFQPLLQTI